MSVLTEELKSNFSNVNEWLNFAEGKNGAIIGFNSAVIFGLSGYIPQYIETEPGIAIPTLISIILLSLGVILSLFSFFPKLSEFSLPAIKSSTNKPNILFFRDIASYEGREYLEEVKGHLNHKEAHTRLDFCYAQQIVNNAKIATRKYQLFKLTVSLTLAATLIMTILAIYILLYN